MIPCSIWFYFNLHCTIPSFFSDNYYKNSLYISYLVATDSTTLFSVIIFAISSPDKNFASTTSFGCHFRHLTFQTNSILQIISPPFPFHCLRKPVPSVSSNVNFQSTPALYLLFHKYSASWKIFLNFAHTIAKLTDCLHNSLD